MSPRKTQPGDFNLTEQLVADIFSGVYKPGDFLPKEIQICKESGLSRTVVRRHLAKLVDGGLVQRISGYGTIVQEYSQWHILDPIVTDWMSRFAAPNVEILRDVLTFRLRIEPYVAATAARKSNAQDLVAIEKAFDGMAEAGGSNTTQQLDSESDVAFHVAIYRATHNIVWAQLSHILRPSIQLVVTEANISTNEPADSLERHRKLMTAIRQRDEDGAFAAAQAVLADTSRTLGLKQI